MIFFYLDPEVSGGLGKDSVIDRSSYPFTVSSLHYEISGWLGGDLLETFPVYVATDKLKKIIINERLTGVVFDYVKITTSEEFEELFFDVVLPRFHWMKIVGIVGSDDFGITSDSRLVVSQNALDIFKSNDINIDMSSAEEYKSSG